jgi:hypothetical protein
MSPEMKNITMQMRAALDQLDQMGGTGPGDAVAATADDVDPATVDKIAKILKEMDGNPQGGAVVKEEMTDEEKKKAEEEAAKSVVKSDEGTHGEDPAEAVVADRSPVDEANIKEVAKSIAAMLKSKQVVHKSESNPLALMMGVIEKQNEQISEVRKGMENILEGFGIADQVRKSITTSAPAKPAERGFDASEVQKSIEQLRTDLFGNRSDANVQKSTGWGWDAAKTDNNSDVRKSISGVLKNNLDVKE